jgi:hypothetical protein
MDSGLFVTAMPDCVGQGIRGGGAGFVEFVLAPTLTAIPGS